MSDKEDAKDNNEEAEEGRKSRAPRLGVEELSKVLKMLLDLKPLIGPETAERLFEGFFRILNRREVLERILHSEFARNVRDMQSEITEAVGLASQADVHDIKKRLDEVNDRLDKLQRTLDDIVVEVEDS
jgi:hypothetical protein